MEEINSVVLIGRLTRDAELKYTKTGTAITNLSIAVNRSIKKDEQWIEEASFFNITLWGRRGEGLNQYLQKGVRVSVKGSLVQERWQQDGENRNRVYIHAENIQLLDSQNRGNNSVSFNQNQRPYSNNSGASKSWQGSPEYKNQSFNGRLNSNDYGKFEDDIPF